MTSSKIDLDNFPIDIDVNPKRKQQRNSSGVPISPHTSLFHLVWLEHISSARCALLSPHSSCQDSCHSQLLPFCAWWMRCMLWLCTDRWCDSFSALVWHKSLLSKEISRLLEKCKGWILGWILTQHRSAGAPICHQSLPTSVAFNGDFSVGFHWLFRGPGHCPGHWSDLG